MPDLLLLLCYLVVVSIMMACLCRIMEILLNEFYIERERRRRRSVIPIDRLIRLNQLREEILRIHHQRVNLNDEIKNFTFPIKDCVIILNPDNNICLGVK
tara:strand:- start:39 stop:338 length:300 start_codon:yes stop_codon:yes gene_type:complete